MYKSKDTFSIRHNNEVTKYTKGELYDLPLELYKAFKSLFIKQRVQKDKELGD
ncbi:MAG: hypothetical protein HOG49_01115 [Candidatus Scalindua sp.]|nr:hypothetical protein [Candidatus Scalindua sp.]